MPRAVVPALLVALLIVPAVPAGAALPPPPVRLGGTWAEAPVCAGPAPVWVRLAGC